MRRSWNLFSILLVVVIFGLTSCGSGLSKLEEKLSRLEDDVADLRRFQAEQTTEISSIQTRLRQVSGKVEEVQYGSQLAHGGVKIAPPQDARPPVPRGVPEAELLADEGLSQKLPPPVSRPFNQALATIRRGDYRAALPLLRQALDYNYDEKVVANLLFWVGVANDGIRQYRDALAAYHDIVSRYPKHVRAPQTLLRQAEVFVQLKDKPTARLTLKKLVAEHPKTKEASLARQRLKRL